MLSGMSNAAGAVSSEGIVNEEQREKIKKSTDYRLGVFDKMVGGNTTR